VEDQQKNGILIPVKVFLVGFFAVIFLGPELASIYRREGAKDIYRCALYGASRENLVRDPELVLENCLRSVK
jgi:hypothetical protein